MTAVAHTAEVDLIPADYRNKRTVLRTLHIVALVCLALVCAAAVLSGVMRNTAAGLRSDIESLQATASLVNQQRSTIAALALRKGALESRLFLLGGLQRGAALEELLRVVGRAVPGDGLWFLEWRIERLGAIVAAAPAGAESWFVVQRQSSAEAPAVRLRMTIAGQARDRSAVSTFVRRLQGDAGIEDVRVQRASRVQDEDLVEFDLLVVADIGSATQ